MKKIITIAATLLCLAALSFCQDNHQYHPIDNNACPLLITDITRGVDDDLAGMDVFVKNNSEKRIVAIQFRLISFTPFKQFFRTSFYATIKQNLTPGRDDHFFLAVGKEDQVEDVYSFNNFVCIEGICYEDGETWVRIQEEIFGPVFAETGSKLPLADILSNRKKDIPSYTTGTIGFMDVNKRNLILGLLAIS